MNNGTYFIIMWSAAVLFILIGIYAMNRKKPMWLWGGVQIPESKIKDVRAYNHAIGKMWCVCAIPLFIGGMIAFFSSAYPVLIFALTCTVGIALVVWRYHKIEETHFVS